MASLNPATLIGSVAGLLKSFLTVTTSLGSASAGAVALLNANGQADPTMMPLDNITLATNSSGLMGQVIPPTPELTQGQILINMLAPVRNKIGYLGDSTCVGVYGSSINGNTYVDKTKSVSYFLAQTLNQLGLNANNDSTFGSGNETNADPRLVLGGGFAVSGAASVGGPCFQANAAGTFTFTPAQPFNAIDIYYIDAASASFSLSVNGGASLGTTTIPGTSGNVINVTTACPLGIGPVQLSWISGTIYLVGIVTHNTLAPAIEIYNLGSGGATSSGYVGPATATSGYGALSGAIATGVTTMLYEIGINDANNGGTTAAQYAANVLSTCQALVLAGINVILVMPHPFNGSAVSIFPSYLTQLRQICAANNFQLIDFYTRYSPVAEWNASGIMATSLHPDYACYRDKANYIASKLFQGSVLPTKSSLSTTGGQVFLAAGNGVIPANATTFRILGAGGGSGGAGGGTVASSGSGGASGGTGVKADSGWLPTSLLTTAAFAVVIGAGGAGGVAGAAGGTGGNSTVTFGSFVFTAYGANSLAPTAGASGAVSVAGKGGGSLYTALAGVTTLYYNAITTGGAACGATGTPTNGSGVAGGPSPGGAGGGLNAGAAVTGGVGGSAISLYGASGNVAGGATGGGAGVAGNSAAASWPLGYDGAGGGGGGGNASGVGGAGGAGSQPGGSGGGGGSGTTGGGHGGNGGAGAIYIEWQ